LLRPLLGITRAEITQYASDNQLEPREDQSNADTTFLRNRIRHDVLPLLEDINPRFQESLARLATIVQGDYGIIRDAVSQITARIVEWDETEAGEVAYVDRHEFMRLSIGLQRHVLRHILFDLSPGMRDIPFAQIEAACALIKNGQAGQQRDLPAENTLSLGYDEFMVHYGGDIPFPRHIPCLQPGQVIPLSTDADKIVNDHMRFYAYWVIEVRSRELHRDDPLEATLAIDADAELSLRTLRPGDRFAPLGLDGHSQKVSDAFTNLKVPKMLRSRVALLTVNEEIAWFVAPTAQGLQGRIAQPFAVSAESESVLRVRWEILTE
jgi:tRNA(Ile)-lysidine synthase